MAATPKVRSLTARLAKLREQRDVTVARYESRLKALRESLLAVAEEKTLLLKQQDEEITDLQRELAAIGAVSGA
jgi:hypothetical protein